MATELLLILSVSVHHSPSSLCSFGSHNGGLLFLFSYSFFFPFSFFNNTLTKSSFIVIWWKSFQIVKLDQSASKKVFLTFPKLNSQTRPKCCHPIDTSKSNSKPCALGPTKKWWSLKPLRMTKKIHRFKFSRRSIPMDRHERIIRIKIADEEN